MLCIWPKSSGQSILRRRRTGTGGRSRITGSAAETITGSARRSLSRPRLERDGAGRPAPKRGGSPRRKIGLCGFAAARNRRCGVTAVRGCGADACRSLTRPDGAGRRIDIPWPVSPRMMAEFGGKSGARFGGKLRSSPKMRVFPVACQRALPSRGNSPSTDGTAEGATGIRLPVPAAERLAMMRVDSPERRSARMRAGLVLPSAPVCSPTRRVETKQACGGSPGDSSKTTR